MDGVWPYLAALLPTILVAILFYFLIKSMLEGDRRERAAQRLFEAQQDRERQQTTSDATESEPGTGGPHGPPEGS
jgi:hypothetical protein